MSGGAVGATPVAGSAESMERYRRHGSTERPGVAQDRAHVPTRAVITGRKDLWRQHGSRDGCVARALRAAGALLLASLNVVFSGYAALRLGSSFVPILGWWGAGGLSVSGLPEMGEARIACWVLVTRPA